MPLWFWAWGTVPQGTCKPIYINSDLETPPTRHACHPRRSLGGVTTAHTNALECSL